MVKNINEKKILNFAVGFLFKEEKVNFTMGNKMYQHIQTIFDEREDGRGYNTLEVVYNYSHQKYEVLLVDEKLKDKEITIL